MDCILRVIGTGIEARDLGVALMTACVEGNVAVLDQVRVSCHTQTLCL